MKLRGKKKGMSTVTYRLHEPIKDLLGKEIEYGENESIQTENNYLSIAKYKTERLTVEPGNYKLSYIRHDVGLKKISYKEKKLETTLSGTQLVRKEIDTFLNNFDVYEKRGLLPKRSVLFYSPPGHGKTSAIVNAVNAVSTDKTLVINWTCGNPGEGEVFDWFSTNVEFSSDIDKFIFVIEDLGGTWEQNHVNVSALLNLLDGSMEIYKLPTMIISTTNYPEKLVEAISSRPGRFDVLSEMPNLTPDDRVALVKFYAHSLIEFDETIVRKDKYKKLTSCHIEEAVNKALLEKLTVEQGLDSMLDFQGKFKKGFSNKERVGIKQN